MCVCVVVVVIIVIDRLLDTPEKTVDFARQMEAAGVIALAVHGRYVSDRPRVPAKWDGIKNVVMALVRPIYVSVSPFHLFMYYGYRLAITIIAISVLALFAALALPQKIPVIANGDIWSYEDFQRIRDETGAAAAMTARGAQVATLPSFFPTFNPRKHTKAQQCVRIAVLPLPLQWNPSIFRKQGRLSLLQVKKDFLTRALEVSFSPYLAFTILESTAPLLLLLQKKKKTCKISCVDSTFPLPALDSTCARISKALHNSLYSPPLVTQVDNGMANTKFIIGELAANGIEHDGSRVKSNEGSQANTEYKAVLKMKSTQDIAAFYGIPSSACTATQPPHHRLHDPKQDDALAMRCQTESASLGASVGCKRSLAAREST